MCIHDTSVKSYLGQASLPCSMSAPIVNHKEFNTLNLFSCCALYPDSHSYGLHLLTKNSPTLTPQYANTIQIQIIGLRGSIKENTPGLVISGFLIIILIPKFMKGLVKSMAISRSYVIVRGAIQKSAF